MKLYATTTSERASKGQGGNDFVKIHIYNAKQQEICRLYVTPTLEGEKIELWELNDKKTEFITIQSNEKGEKQKGE
jgi:hypothetical protein